MTTAADPNADGLPLEEVPCDYCGSMEADILLTGRDRTSGWPGRFHVVRCRQCGLARTNPRPTLEALGKAYPATYECYRADSLPAGPPRGFLRWALINYRGYPPGRRSPAIVRWLLAPWATLRLRNRKAVGYLPFEWDGRLLDFGCGSGRYVAQMAAAGWRAEGMDLVASAVRTGRRMGLTIHEGTLPGAALPEASYDLVTMWHALEHVPRPLATLKAARALLRPGGRLAVVCPLSDSLTARWFGEAWYGLDVPRHLTHFTQATLGRHLESAGFVVESVHPIRRPTFVHRSFGYRAEDTGRWIHRRLSRCHALSRGVSHLAAALRRTDEALFIAKRPQG